MSIVRLFHGPGDQTTLNTAYVIPCQARYVDGRHPKINVLTNATCDFRYILEALYLGTPLLMKKEGVGEVISLHGVRRIQFLPDSMSEASQALRRVEDTETLVRAHFPLGEEALEFPAESVRRYEVNGMGTKNRTLALKSEPGCDHNYLIGAFHCGEPIALLYDGKEEHGDIIDLRGARKLVIAPPR